MAAIEYVDTTIGAGANDGTSWANAWRTDPTALSSAFASMDAGGRTYIQSDCIHLFAGNIILASANGVAGNPCTIISVKNFNEPPVEGDFETMTVGGGNLDAKTNGAFDITLASWDIWMGMEFIVGDNLTMGAINTDVKLINCKLIVDDNSSYIDDSHTYWENVDFVQVTTGGFSSTGDFEWRGGSFSFGGGSVVNLFTLSATRGGHLWVFDVDIQDLDAGDYLVNDVNIGWDVLIKRCKIPAACNYMNNGPTGASCKVRFHSVDSGDGQQKLKEYYFEGSIHSDTAIYQTSVFSAKMIADKGNTVNWSRPLRFELSKRRYATNPTIEIHWNLDQAATIQNNELWFEIEYPDETDEALGRIDRTSRPATILTAAADQGSAEGDPGGWTEAFANPQARSKAISITDGAAGIYTVWACLAKEATVYFEPIPVVS